MEEDEFIRSVRARRYEDDRRLRYADWLDERGDSRAEFLRLECELLRGNDREPGYAAALGRWLNWRPHLPPGWLDGLGSRVNGLPLPRALTDLLATRRWGARANQYLLPSALRHLTMDGLFDTYAEDVMQPRTAEWVGLAWLGKTDAEHSPGDIDPRLTVLIADLGPASETPFALDYRASLGRPKVVVYLWHVAPGPHDVTAGDVGNRWVEAAPDFPTFWQQLGSGTA